ncbi:MAG: hypothetical protein Q8L48_38920 [Archangium sp.]|nr:hypothetical protein [Archangium sp.]
MLALLVAGLIVFALKGARWIAAVALLAWFGVVFGLAASGVLGAFERMPPKIPLVALGAVGVGLLVSRVAAVKEALRVMPSWWPVALQTFRAPLELALYLLFTSGQLPEQMTFAGRNFDVLVGLSAPVMAFLIATKRAPAWSQWLWQLGAVALLINVVGIAITSAPGPLHSTGRGRRSPSWRSGRTRCCPGSSCRARCWGTRWRSRGSARPLVAERNGLPRRAPFAARERAWARIREAARPLHEPGLMRGALLCTMAVLAGCWGSPVSQAPECQAWVGCIRALDAPGETTDLERFVEGGFCWNNPTLAEGCTTACARALARLRDRESSLPSECQP